MEQLRDRIRHISQDMHVINRSCCVEMATSSVPQASRRAAVRLRASQTRLPRSTQKRRRRTQRRRRRSEKRACSDTIEESSSADEVDARRKRARDCKESPSRPLLYIQSDTSLLLHITTVRTHGRCSYDMRYHERASVHFTVARSLRLKSGVSHDLCQSSPALAPLSDFAHGCAGVRFGEARNPGPATHDGDRKQNNVTPATDASTKQETQCPAARTLLCAGPQPAVGRYTRRIDCSSSSSTSTDAKLSETSSSAAEATASSIVVQILPPSKEPQTTASCNTWFRSTWATAPPRKRRTAARDAAPDRSPTRQQPPHSSQRVSPGDPLDDSPLPNCSIRGIVLTERDKQLLAELRRASAMALPRCIVSR